MELVVFVQYKLGICNAIANLSEYGTICPKHVTISCISPQ